jgi:ABC-2 type transport system ATP-binding protein
VDAAIEVDGLVKAYGPLRAVDGISFRVAPGEVFAILGPNGAGKTTTVEILEGHRRADAGRVRVLGMDPAADGRAYRERIGIVLQSGAIERELTPLEALRSWRLAYPAPREPEEVLALVGLWDKREARIGTLSGGQQRRLDLALGLIGDPELVFLDEPTTGFDPAARREAWRLVERLADLGKTVLLTTHYLDEAQHLADRVAVIVRGRLVAIGEPSEIGAERTRMTRIGFGLPRGTGVPDLPVEVRARASASDGRVVIETRHPTEMVNVVTGWALARGLELHELSVTRPSLEDVYLEIVAERDDEGRDA